LTEEQAVKLLSTNLFGFSPRHTNVPTSSDSDVEEEDESEAEVESDDEDADDEDIQEEEEEEINGRPDQKRRRASDWGITTGIMGGRSEDMEWKPNHKGRSRKKRFSKGAGSDDGGDFSPSFSEDSPAMSSPRIASPISSDLNPPTLLVIFFHFKITHMLCHRKQQFKCWRISARKEFMLSRLIKFGT
jgi:hypothetical protein